MGLGHASTSYDGVFSGTTPDRVTIDQVWSSIIISNHDSTHTMWIRQDGTETPADAVASGVGCVSIGPLASITIAGIPTPSNTLVISCVGNGGAYTVAGVRTGEGFNEDGGTVLTVGTGGDYPTLQAAYDAAITGDTISLVSDITVSAALESTKYLRWRGNGFTVTQQTANTRVLRITTQAAARTDIRDFRWVGPQYAARRTSERAIEVVGTYLLPISGIKVIDCEFESWGESPLVLQFCTKYKIKGNTLTNSYYAGVEAISSTYGDVSFNTVDGVWADGVLNSLAYGMFFSRNNSDSLTTDPRCSATLCSYNTILNVPTWEALDTHGGQGITFANNYAYNCRVGIAIGESANGAGTYIFAPLDCSAIDNDLDSGVTNGSQAYAINITGCIGGGVGSSGALATGCKATGNTIRGFGLEASTIGTAVFIRNTLGCIVSDNEIIEPGASGINFYHDNFGYTCDGNVIVDPWSETVGIAEGVGIWASRSDYNYGTLSGNSIVRGTRVATYICTGAIGTAGNAHQSFTLGPIYSDATTTIRDTSALLAVRLRATLIGLYNATPVARAAAITKPTAPSAAYSQAEAATMKTAVDALIDALKNIGVTT